MTDTTPTRSPVIRFDDVSFAHGESRVLEGVTFEVGHGDYLAVLGPNGGGKTTLLKLMLGLLKPRTGRVEMFGGPPAQALSRIGYVPQYTGARLDFPVTVLDAVLMGMAGMHHGLVGRHWIRDRASVDKARTVLQQVGLDGFDDRPFGRLSGGQRQRAVVARALMGDPELLLLDEPTASIDPQGKFCFYEFLGGLHGPRTIVVVSHDLSLASTGFTSVAFVNRSVLVGRGGGLTRDMLQMLYGQHDPTCPMGSFIQSMTSIFPQQPPEA